mmetsp:Transcript_5835/g.10519  ORF Transcript_5835/g.10519 Transcript_5835/m.10519 type:complete len:428 (-) Transcript_5835:55-1338(-)
MFHEVSFIDHAHTALRALHDRLSAHATTLGSKIDALTRALSHIPCRITHEDGAVLHAPRARVLRDRVGLNTNDLPALNAYGGTVTDALLVALDSLLVDDGAGSDCHVVALGEDPGVEIWRHIISHVHLGTVLIVVHLRLRDAHALLESNGILVVASLNVLCDAAVGAICSHHNINFKGLLLPLAGIAFLAAKVVVGEGVCLALVLRDGHSHEEAIDQGGPVLLSPLSKEVIQHLTAHHSNEFVILEGLTDLDFLVGRGDHGHLLHLAVNDVLGEVELVNHAQRNSTTTRLAVVKLALNQVGLNSFLGQGVGRACPCGSTANDGHAELAPLGERGARADNHLCFGEGLWLLLELGHAHTLGKRGTVLTPAAGGRHSPEGRQANSSAGRGRKRWASWGRLGRLSRRTTECLDSLDGGARRDGHESCHAR